MSRAQVMRAPKTLRAMRAFAREVLQELWPREKPDQAASRPGSPKRVRELLARGEKLLRKVGVAAHLSMHARCIACAHPQHAPSSRRRGLPLMAALVKGLSAVLCVYHGLRFPVCCAAAPCMSLLVCRVLAREKEEPWCLTVSLACMHADGGG